MRIMGKSTLKKPKLDIYTNENNVTIFISLLQ